MSTLDQSTLRRETVHLDKSRASTCGTIQYLLEQASTEVPVPPPISADNHLQLFICGEKGFEQIAKDIQSAQRSIDLICWGFDPSMMIIRPEDGEWRQENSFGYLLEQAAQEGVSVRLLVWYTYIGNLIQNNLRGETRIHKHEQRYRQGLQEGVGATNEGDARWEYSTGWLERSKQQQLLHVQFRTRKADSSTTKASLSDEKYLPSTQGFPFLTENSLLTSKATHHQKTILIDYQRGAGNDTPQGVGYVMGLNSVGEYWDTQEHLIEDPRREPADQSQRKDGFITFMPYQDYASRFTGSALHEVHSNFQQAWERADGGAFSPGARTGPNAGKKADPLFPRSCQKPVRLQVLRTQPQDSDKSIKAFYMHSPLVAQHYLYQENQYYQYQEWAEQLLAAREKRITNWHECLAASTEPDITDNISRADLPILHLFTVIPELERKQMVPRTYDTLRVLGQEGAMRGKKVDPKTGKETDEEIGQDVRIKSYEERLAEQKQYRSDVGLYEQGQTMTPPAATTAPEQAAGTTAQPSQGVKQTAAAIPRKDETELRRSYGLRVCTAMLYTSGVVNGKMRYRHIYIHSKLMLVDDGALTVGSANLNQRSMTVDSEINIACDDAPTVRSFRAEVFAQHSGGTISGGDGAQVAMSNAFKKWTKLMENNADIRKAGKEQMTGFLLPFKELRESETRYG
ncbi:phospholipase D-like domain-containing protein [Neisseriaceae bacterium TC5R-5]|nr:phospholipase D-like domain-containing protein [Neisseriaceae bacterium TC5R-5]